MLISLVAVASAAINPPPSSSVVAHDHPRRPLQYSYIIVAAAETTRPSITKPPQVLALPRIATAVFAVSHFQNVVLSRLVEK